MVSCCVACFQGGRTYVQTCLCVSACYVQHGSNWSPRCCCCKSVPISVCPLAKPHKNAVKMKAAKRNKLCLLKGLQKKIIWQTFYGTSSFAVPVCWIQWNSLFKVRVFYIKCALAHPHWVGRILLHFLVTSCNSFFWKSSKYLIDILCYYFLCPVSAISVLSSLYFIQSLNSNRASSKEMFFRTSAVWLTCRNFN